MKEYFVKAKTFILEAYQEFWKVTWPSREKTIRLTAYVIGVSLGVAVFVWLADTILKEFLGAFLNI